MSNKERVYADANPWKAWTHTFPYDFFISAFKIAFIVGGGAWGGAVREPLKLLEEPPNKCNRATRTE